MCERVELPGGGFAIVCGGHARKRRCAYPDCRANATIECDHVGRSGFGLFDENKIRCDRATCRAHAKPIAKNVDWCWLCAREEAKRGNSPRLAL